MWYPLSLVVDEITGLHWITIAVFIVVVALTQEIMRKIYRWAYSSDEGYRSDVAPTVRKLVHVAAPKLVTNERFTKEDVESIIGKDPNFDAEMYYHFKREMDQKTLTEDRLMRSVS